MKTMTFSSRVAKEILRDPLNLAFGLGFPVILLLMMINLTEFGRKVVGISECSEYSDFQSSHRSNKIQQKNNL